MTDTDRYTEARRRAKAKYGFLVHLTIYAVVMLFLLIIDLLTGRGLWFFWPLIGWGFAVALHGIGVYSANERSAAIDALTERELRNMETHQQD